MDGAGVSGLGVGTSDGLGVGDSDGGDDGGDEGGDDTDGAGDVSLFGVGDTEGEYEIVGSVEFFSPSKKIRESLSSSTDLINDEEAKPSSPSLLIL